MAHIAICVSAGTGHVNPTLGVAAELVDWGHRVSYAATAEHAGRIADVGARLVPYASTLQAEALPQFSARDLPRATTAALREAEQVLPQVLAGFGGDEPELLVTRA